MRGLVRPQIDEAEASRIAQELYGIEGSVQELGSNQDRNFRIQTAGGPYLLKVDNAAFTGEELLAQNQGMAHLAAAGIAVPVPVPGRDGGSVQFWDLGNDRYGVRLLTYVGGSTLADVGYLTPAAVRGMGHLAGRVSLALESFEAAGLERNLQWDLRNAAAVVEHLIGGVADVGRRDLLLGRTREAAARLASVAETLRIQPIHADLTDDNMLCPAPSFKDPVPDAVIDFGDLSTGWLVAELAVLCASVLHHQPTEPLAVLEAVQAFDALVKLTDEEITALWPLIVLRGAVLVVSGEHQVKIDVGNDYAVERMAAEWEVFRVAQAVDWEAAEAALRATLDRPGRWVADLGTATPAPMLAALVEGDFEFLDFTTTSPLLHEGRWLQPAIESELAVDALQRVRAAVAPYLHGRLTRATGATIAEPETQPLFTEVFTAAGQRVLSPVDGTVRANAADGVRIEAQGFDLRIDGLASDLVAGDELSAGDCLGTAEDRGNGFGRIRVQGLRGHGLDAPWFTDQAWTAAWRLLTFDPAPLLGIPILSEPVDPAAERQRRARATVSAQEKYYERPPQIERGWREYLIDMTGRPYLDMVNNVAAIGHSHPRLAKAVHDQLQLLNTNSRFLYRVYTDLTERLVALAPHPSLDTVLLVNSGTEAVDLALRLAQVHSGRRTVVALREGYHGWSMAADAVSTSAYDNPHALDSRPDWVEIADVPNTYRGTHRGGAAGERYFADLVAQLDVLEAKGRPLGGFICEPILGNAGGIVLPAGYLASVYDDVRRRGGVVIADEVQVGYGRFGRTFWGVQQQDVVPDVISVAKAMGNGYPVGAVITRREIAESLGREGMFFSSAGGATASCAAALAVLDVMRDEGLQENAQVVGDHLAGRLRDLGDRHPIVGAVHGMGLFLGLELVRDRTSLEPADAETSAVCERLLRMGVIMQATSERQNVLKIKPPLCLTRANADYFVEALDEALSGALRD